MSAKLLTEALSKVDWKKNIDDFLGDEDAVGDVASANERIALWGKQFELADSGNPALCFSREMQISSQAVTALLGLALYRQAASAMRSLVEAAMYYSYFRTHEQELATLARDSSYYIDKREILEYHKKHTFNFSKKQHDIGLIPALNEWYSNISMIIHGQLPGLWINHTALEDISSNAETLKLARGEFIKAENIVRKFLLISVAPPILVGFSSYSKGRLLKGLSGQQKLAIDLDEA